MGELRVMGSKGDTKHIWNPDDENEVKAIKKIWDDLVGKKRYLGFRVKRDGEPGEQIREFPADAGKLVITPPMAGGR